MKPIKGCIRIVVTSLCLFAAQIEAREFSFDFSSQGTDSASAPVYSFAVGDTVNLSLPAGQPSFSLEIVSAPPPGIAGQSYIARDTQSQASAVVKPTKDGLRVTIDDFEHQKIYSVRVRDGVVEATVRDTSGVAGDVCGTCGGDVEMPPADQVPVATNEAVSAATPRTASRLKSAMRGYLHRDGTVAQPAKGNLFKGPFHIPRMMTKSIELANSSFCRTTSCTAINSKNSTNFRF